ncbi:hypothetical protein FCV25MIE_18733 [Fagus crenata]
MTNGPTAKASKSGTGSWKKKARAQGNGPRVPSIYLAEKRHCEAMLIDSDIETTSRPEKGPPHTTWVRLDRGLANMEWLQRNPSARVEHMDVTNSDHKSVLQAN